jgi:hypothetical protein
MASVYMPDRGTSAQYGSSGFGAWQYDQNSAEKVMFAGGLTAAAFGTGLYLMQGAAAIGTWLGATRDRWGPWIADEAAFEYSGQIYPGSWTAGEAIYRASWIALPAIEGYYPTGPAVYNSLLEYGAWGFGDWVQRLNE